MYINYKYIYVLVWCIRNNIATRRHPCASRDLAARERTH